MADYSYKLTLGNKVTAPETTVTKITLDQNTDTVFTSAEKKTFNMRLHGFSIHKKIYQPNHIEAEVIFTNILPTFSEISTLFKGRLVSVQATYLAKPEENYYVQEVIPLLTTDSSGKTTLSVKLNIFSLDKLMTLSKYSKAYVARKLGSGILKIEARNFGYSNTSEKTPLINTNITGMQILRYKQAVTVQLPNDKKATTYIPSEFIHPYLIQYNESFYDFMARCANRFGEFLFFEDGKLNLGLDTSSTDIKEIKDFNSIIAQDCTDGIFDVESYRRDSAKNNSDAPTGYQLNQTFIKKEKNYPDDAFPKTNQFVYNTEAVNDEYLFPLYKDKFDNYDREMNFDGASNGSDGDKAAAFLIPVIKNLLKNEETMWLSGLAASLVQAVINDFSFRSNLVHVDIGRTNDKMNKAHIDSLAKLTEQTDGNKAVQFGSVDSSGWFTLDYYKQIHKPQSKVQQEIICIDLGTNVLDVKLGQKIKVNSLGESEYIVIQIEQDSEITWAHKYEQQNNVMTLNKVKTVPQRSLKIYAIPISTITDKSKKYLPPVQAAPIIRKAGPQTAFVTDNGDPKHQGRVRVMYPWQTSSELVELKKQADISVVNTTAAKNKEEKANRELNELEDKWETDYQRLQDVIKFLNKSVSDRNNLLESIKNDIKNLEDTYKNTLYPEFQRLAMILNSSRSSSFEKNKAKRQLDVIQNSIDENRAKLDYLTQQQKDFEKAYNDKVKDPNATTPVDKDKYDDNTNPVVVELTTSLEETRLKLAEARREYEEAAIELNKQKAEDDEINKKIETVYKTLSSPWIRVATPMATSGGGTYFKPQKGDEVLVDYDNGNIERPYVVGSLFSKNVLDPQEFLDRKNTQGGGNATMAIVSPNGHHITFSDPSGNLDFLSKMLLPGVGMYASLFGQKTKDLNDLKDLGGGIHIGDRYGIYEIDMKSQSRSISIKSPFGSIDLNAFTGITINAPNGDVKIKGKNISLEAGNKITVTSGKNIPDSSDDSIGILVGKAAVKTFLTDLTKTYVTSLVDLTLVRSVIETFARPVDGTLLLKSKKYLKLEAGKGEANVKTDRYYKISDEKQYLNEQFFNIIQDHVGKISRAVDTYFSTYKQLCDNAREVQTEYKHFLGDKLQQENVPNVPEKAYKEKGNEHATLLTSENLDEFKKQLRKKFENVRNFEAVLPKINAYKTSMHNVYKYVSDQYIKDQLIIPDNNLSDAFKFISEASKKLFDDNSPTWIQKQFKDWTDKYKDGANLDFLDSKKIDDPFHESKRKYFKRAAILLFLYQVYTEQEKKNRTDLTKLNYIKISSPYKINDTHNPDLTIDHEWAKLVDTIEKDIVKSKWQTAKEDANELTGKKVGDTINEFKAICKHLYDKEVWNNNLPGQILFSDDEDGTHQFEKDGIKIEPNYNINSFKHYLKNIK
jgi:hypothetical protein